MRRAQTSGKTNAVATWVLADLSRACNDGRVRGGATTRLYFLTKVGRRWRPKGSATSRAASHLATTCVPNHHPMTRVAHEDDHLPSHITTSHRRALSYPTRTVTGLLSYSPVTPRRVTVARVVSSPAPQPR